MEHPTNSKQTTNQPDSVQTEKQKKHRFHLPQFLQNANSQWTRALMLVIITVVFCGLLAVFLLQSAFDMFGLNQEDNIVEVTIPDDASLAQITSILCKSDVVDKRLTFYVYASIKQDEKYYGGHYVMNSNMGYDEILRDLRTGADDQSTVTITFTEGSNAYEIAKQLEENGVCGADEFLDYLETTDFDYDFVKQIPDSDLRFRRMEGYLFPDTYEFYVDENIDSVVRRFLDNFDSKITTEMLNQIEAENTTLDEVITLASIIQKETGGINGLEEMQRVSSVFHNRINSSTYPKLQSDVTLNYVENFIKPFLEFTNQEMYDAYNTYECYGLPVAPICSPGIEAIQAALSPADTNYYFFVTDVQDNFYYAETLSQHNKNIATAEKVEGDGEIHGTNTEK